MSRLQLAIDQIRSSRAYTLRLAQAIDPSDWYRQPPGGITHVAWQLGHVAYAEYRLALWRIRGPRPEDAELMPEAFGRLFGAESLPDPDPAHQPSPAAIREVLERVHEHAMRELLDLSEAELDDPVGRPHPFARTKFLALLWCAQHELVHAGQIGLLRRQLGYPPMW